MKYLFLFLSLAATAFAGPYNKVQIVDGSGNPTAYERVTIVSESGSNVQVVEASELPPKSLTPFSSSLTYQPEFLDTFDGTQGLTITSGSLVATSGTWVFSTDSNGSALINNHEVVLSPGTGNHGSLIQSATQSAVSAIGKAVIADIRVGDTSIAGGLDRIGWYSTSLPNTNYAPHIGFEVGVNGIRSIYCSSSGTGYANAAIGSDEIRRGDVMRAAVRIDGTNSYSVWVQGGFYSQQNMSVGSNKWFPLPVGTLPTQVLDGLSAAIIGRGASATFDNVKIGKFQTDNSAALIADLATGLKTQVPSLYTDTSGNQWAACQTGTNDTTSDVQVIVRRRIQNGSFSAPAVAAIGSGSTRYNNGAICEFGSKGLILILNKTTDSWGTASPVYRSISFDGTTVSFGTETPLGVPAIPSQVGETLCYAHPVTFGGTIYLPIVDGEGVTANPVTFAIARTTNSGATWALSNAMTGSEPTLAVSASNTFICYSRSSPYLKRSTSADGITFTTPATSNIPCPDSRAVIITLIDGRHLIAGNDNTTDSARNRVTVWTVDDNDTILAKTPIWGIGTLVTGMYPDISYHAGKISAVWAQSTACYFLEQPLDGLGRNASAELKALSDTKADAQDILSKSGTVGVANGGTGITSYTTGDLLYASGSNAVGKLADVATGNVVISGGVGSPFTAGKVTIAHTTGIAASGSNSDLTSINGAGGGLTINNTAAGGTIFLNYIGGASSGFIMGNGSVGKTQFVCDNSGNLDLYTKDTNTHALQAGQDGNMTFYKGILVTGTTRMTSGVIVTLSGTYYPHDAAGVLSWTTAP